MNAADLLFAAVLLLAAMLAALVLQGARSGAKMFGYLAAALFAVFALSQIARAAIGETAFGAAVAGALSGAPLALTFVVFHKVAGRIAVGPALAILVAGAALGLAGGYFDHPEWAIGILMVNAIALIVLGALHVRSNRREALLLLASALALAAGGASFAIAGERDVSLFAAAALIGIAVAVSPRSRAAIKKQAWRSRTLSVRRKG